MHQTQYQSRQKLLDKINSGRCVSLVFRDVLLSADKYVVYSSGRVFVKATTDLYLNLCFLKVYVDDREVDYEVLGSKYDAVEINITGYKRGKNGSPFVYLLHTALDKPDSKVTAPSILGSAKEALDQRAALRDSEGTGERSIAKTVDIFNAWTGRDLTEQEGWKFMVALKQARESQGKFHEDDYVDGASYFALLGESCAKETQTKTT